MGRMRKKGFGCFLNKVHKRDLVISTGQTICAKNTKKTSFVRKEYLQKQCDMALVKTKITTRQTIRTKNTQNPSYARKESLQKQCDTALVKTKITTRQTISTKM